MKPIQMIPYYRHGAQTPWGGEKLRTRFGKDIPDTETGESLEVSALPGMESRDPQGRTLSELLREGGEAMRGTQVAERFPLLLKLIDAKDRLSVQVHPDDAYAGRFEGGKLGKTEAWVILDAPVDAQIVYGVRKGVSKRQLQQALAKGTIEDSLRFLSVKPGDVIYIPAGMIHAIGEDILLYEIQQSSDLTYRFWDWNRQDEEGKYRELHLEKGLDVVDVTLQLPKVEGTRKKVTGGFRTDLIQDNNFSLARLEVRKAMPLEEMPQRFRLLTALCEGFAVCEEGAVPFKPGESLFIPASCPRLKLECQGELLLAAPARIG